MRIFAILLFTFNSILFNNNLEDGFVYLKDIDHSVLVDLKYYSSENFTGQLVEGYHSNTAILTNEAALALSNAQDDFNKYYMMHTDLKELLIFLYNGQRTKMIPLIKEPIILILKNKNYLN